MIGAILAKRKVRSSYEFLNHRELTTFLADWAENASFIYPGHVPSVSGRMDGKQAIEKWFQHFMEQFPKINFKLKNVYVENPLAFGGTNHVAVEWDIALTNKHGQDFQNDGVTTIDIRGGRAVLVRDYINNSETDLFTKLWGA